MLDNRLADGLVRSTRGENGWIHVQIGRARKTKQFYLSDAEARLLIIELTRLFSTNDDLAFQGAEPPATPLKPHR